MSANPTVEIEELRAEVALLRSKLAHAVPLTEYDAQLELLGQAIAEMGESLLGLDQFFGVDDSTVRDHIRFDAAADAAEQALAMFRTRSGDTPMSPTPPAASTAGARDLPTPQGAIPA